MDLFTNPEKLDRYLEAHSSPEESVLAELNRHTYLKEVHPRMLSGPVLGTFLRMFSQMLSPGRILEIGTYTGYSAINLARGLRPDGKLFTIEINEELRATTLSFFEQAGLSHQIELINGNALDVIPSLDESFDLVFMDAFKDDYPAYYKLVLEKLVPGGYILADNVLWGGKVLEDGVSDDTTQAIREFNRMVSADDRVENLLLPIRDGVMLIKKLKLFNF